MLWWGGRGEAVELVVVGALVLVVMGDHNNASGNSDSEVPGCNSCTSEEKSTRLQEIKDYRILSKSSAGFY